ESGESFFECLAGVAFAQSGVLDDEDLPADSMVGRTIRHYHIVSHIGSGGMGTVYQAHDSRLDRRVALEFLPSHVGENVDSADRLLVEARAAAGLQHPNVCTIHAVGETDDGRPFIAMELYEGESLKHRLRRGTLTVQEVVAIGVQVTRALVAAHARGVVHRDVK